MNTTKKSAADATAVASRIAAKIAVKKAAEQAAAETAEAKQKTKKKKKKNKDKATEEEATKDAKQAISAEDAALAKATKEDEAVRLARGLTSDSAPLPGWATAGPRPRALHEVQAAPPEPQLLPVAPGLPGCLRLWAMPRFREERLPKAVAPGDHASLSCNVPSGIAPLNL